MSTDPAERTLETMLDDELATGDPRSAEYRLGMLDVLRFRANGIPIPRRYDPGTVQADAYFAGNERGHALWRRHQGKFEGNEPRPQP